MVGKCTRQALDRNTAISLPICTDETTHFPSHVDALQVNRGIPAEGEEEDGASSRRLRFFRSTPTS